MFGPKQLENQGSLPSDRAMENKREFEERNAKFKIGHVGFLGAYGP